jgi:hypothetical protein
MATSFTEGKLHPSRRRSGTILCWNWQMLAAFGLRSPLFASKAVNRLKVCGQFLPLSRKFQILILYIQMRRTFGGVHALLGLPLVIFRAPGHRSIPYCRRTIAFGSAFPEPLDPQQQLRICWVRSKKEYPSFAISALSPKADMCSALVHVRFGPKADMRRFEPQNSRSPSLAARASRAIAL